MGKYGEQYRELIIKSATNRAIPGVFRYLGGWFDICPVNDAADVLGIPKRNDAYRLLTVYHCVTWLRIPRTIRQRFPELIQEALTPVRAAAEQEESK
jgi:hypothetical protein